MVWTGVLRAVLLLSLLSSGIRDVEGQEPVDLKALEHIIELINVHAAPSGSGTAFRNFLNRLLSILTFICPCLSARARESTNQQSPIHRQYAIAIRTAREDCLQGFDKSQTIFDLLRREVGTFNRTLHARGNNTVYIGQHVIAATYKNNKHSEYRLLIENNGAAIINLTTAEGRHDDCLIFYTYNSPCLKMCLNETADNRRSGTQKCIYSFLDTLTSLQGPKAFVFTQIYREDERKTDLLIDAFRNITYEIPLYQCNSNKCKRCEERNNFCVPANARPSGMAWTG